MLTIELRRDIIINIVDRYKTLGGRKGNFFKQIHYNFLKRKNEKNWKKYLTDRKV